MPVFCWDDGEVQVHADVLTQQLPRMQWLQCPTQITQTSIIMVILGDVASVLN